MLLYRKQKRGSLPDFQQSTWAQNIINDPSWKVKPPPKWLLDRRVEITGPPTPLKMVINGAKSGAQGVMFCFEDAQSPTAFNVVDGQFNMQGLIDGSSKAPSGDEKYKLDGPLGPDTIKLWVRPRGLHLEEAHMRVDKNLVSGSLFDFGLMFYHNARALQDLGLSPLFYLAKLEDPLEAKWWNDVITFSEQEMGVEQDSTCVTMLNETIDFTFNIELMLWMFRNRNASCNAGRWDEIFSYIKRMASVDVGSLKGVPDRGEITMSQPFMNSYVDQLVRVCHARGTFAMGGMSAAIPDKRNPEVTTRQITKVEDDKLREIASGHDGTWVAHPDLVGVAQSLMESGFCGTNQFNFAGSDRHIGQKELLEIPTGNLTPEGVELDVVACILYMHNWIKGVGAVPLFNNMEDSATAEISRVLSWVRQKNGQVSVSEIDACIDRLENQYPEENFEKAIDVFRQTAMGCTLPEFMTTYAYEKHLVDSQGLQNSDAWEEVPVC